MAGWERSGKSQRTYCAEQGLALSSFQWWRRNLLARQAVVNSESLPQEREAAAGAPCCWRRLAEPLFQTHAKITKRCGMDGPVGYPCGSNAVAFKGERDQL